MARFKPDRLVVIGGTIMLLGAVALAYGLAGHGTAAVEQVADKKPAAHAKGEGPLHHMKLKAQFAGPLRDTVIQRWEDPDTKTVCYIYLPIVVRHSPRLPNGRVQYGANGIGSISCLPRR